MNIKNKRKRIYKNKGYYSNLTEADIRQFINDLVAAPVQKTTDLLMMMNYLNEHK